MPMKPNKETILETYSLEELLDLALEKEKQDRMNRKDQVERHLSELLEILEGNDGNELKSKLSQYRTSEDDTQTESSQSTPITRMGKERNLERKSTPKSTRKSSQKAQSKSSGKTAKKQPLSSLLVESVGKKPMSIDEIMDSLLQSGWKSKSSNPRSILNIELGKQVEKGNLKKAGRGMYIKG